MRNSVLQCKLCSIRYHGSNPVAGNGNANSDILIVGDKTGYHENKNSVPFSGHGGTYLRTVLTNTGFYRNNIFFTNVIKCYFGNRYITKKNVNNCTPHFKNELDKLDAKIIILLGRFAHESVFGKTNIKMSKLNKSVYITKHGTYIITLYHPNYVLNNAAYLDEQFVANFKKINKLYIKLFNPNYKFLNSL